MRAERRSHADTRLVLDGSITALPSDRPGPGLRWTNTSAGSDWLGGFEETALRWVSPAAEHSAAAIDIVTSVRLYSALPHVAIFRTEVGSGLQRTNRSGELPVVGFPSVALESAETLGFALWHGLWPDPVVGQNLSVPLPGRPNYHDGPVAWSCPEAAGKPRLSLLVGPLSDPLNTVVK